MRPNQAQSRQSEENEGDQNLIEPETKLNWDEYERNEPNSTRHLQRLHQEQMQMRTTASDPRTRGKDTRGREFYVTKKDVERFGPTAGCPACANATKDGSRNVNRFVYKPTKWMSNSKALAQALSKRYSNRSEPPFHRHMVLN